ncbi:MAG TPA: alpha/beta fold hydrolase [Ilumatobacteraceae bacterium]
MTTLSAAPALEAPARQVGRRTLSLVDHNRDDRRLAVDVWYPAVESTEPLTRYEVLPSIAFEAAVARDSPSVAAGLHPLLIVSHGRTGMGIAYSLLCESLAARGFIVVAPDHPGDALNDWLSGTFVDDRANEVGRVADARFLLDVLLDPNGAAPELSAAVDPDRIAIVGHSYGAYTGLGAAAGVHGVAADERVRAVAGLQPYTRSMSDAALGRVHVPTLIVVSEHDTTTPIATDGDRPWALIPARPMWRLDLGSAAHHASSDMGLYLELAGQIPDLPPMVATYVAMMTPDMIGPHLRAWRDGLGIVVRAVSAFLDVALSIDIERGEAEAAVLSATHDVTLQRR